MKALAWRLVRKMEIEKPSRKMFHNRAWRTIGRRSKGKEMKHTMGTLFTNRSRERGRPWI